jgi:precorrin-6A/cobalt-precorrin-6A reductase
LVGYLRAEGISHVVDATHPFAAQMSRNAAQACALAGVPLIGLERPGWAAVEGDRWVQVADTAAAVAALPDTPARVFLAIGKQTLADFAVKSQHHYLLRLVDPPKGALPLPDAFAVIDTGPFTVDGDLALLKDHRISHIVAKNAGGVGAAAKLTAARALGLPVILIDRPKLPARQVVADVADVMAWLRHGLGTERGV